MGSAARRWDDTRPCGPMPFDAMRDRGRRGAAGAAGAAAATGLVPSSVWLHQRLGGVRGGGSRGERGAAATGQCFNSLPGRQQRFRNFSSLSCLTRNCPAASRGCGTQMAQEGLPLVPSRIFRISWEPKACSRLAPSVPNTQICSATPLPHARHRARQAARRSVPALVTHGLASTGDHGPLKPHVNLTIVARAGHDTTDKTLLDVRTITRSLEISLCFWKSSDPLGCQETNLKRTTRGSALRPPHVMSPPCIVLLQR
ncbi:hypothetical protein B0T16DRAFT_19367 [Cercophora newfieldiana]|uniref:Uncharacterized protein n=1 Tax=Cercophora newfieldiana TaxID=92897 RepID=A0AA40CZ32_9PEZI|nr:hypothetical protein B0T16DRAFT_19367 [Cercophora newfieldiana]